MDLNDLIEQGLESRRNRLLDGQKRMEAKRRTLYGRNISGRYDPVYGKQEIRHPDGSSSLGGPLSNASPGVGAHVQFTRGGVEGLYDYRATVPLTGGINTGEELPPALPIPDPVPEPTYCATFTALRARFQGNYTPAQLQAMANLVCGLETEGIWQKLDVVWIFGSPASEASGDFRVNWKSNTFPFQPTLNPTPPDPGDPLYFAYVPLFGCQIWGFQAMTVPFPYTAVNQNGHLGWYRYRNQGSYAAIQIGDSANGPRLRMLFEAGNLPNINSFAILGATGQFLSIPNAAVPGFIQVNRLPFPDFDYYMEASGQSDDTASNGFLDVTPNPSLLLLETQGNNEHMQLLAITSGQGLTRLEASRLRIALDTYFTAIGSI